MVSNENLVLAKKWSKRWEDEQTYATTPQTVPKYFITFPFPYVNGAPHVGHAYSCFRADVFARFKRLQGFNVLFPQGFHATGEPIVGAQKRLIADDPTQIATMRAFGASDEQIDRMKSDPNYIVSFWRERWIADLKLGGLSIDWSRTFTTTDLTPAFSRFVSWQYRTLKDLGFIKQGTHPVVWDPSTSSPTGDHDRYEGEGESPQRFSVVLFDSELGRFACATLRPETVFEVTNLWIADEPYVRARVDDSTWIIHRSAALKLADQLHDVEIFDEVSPGELVSISARHPLSGAQLPIFTSPFVKAEHGTGVVMSVPAHAPYDYLALKALREPGEALLASTKNLIALDEVPNGMLNAAFYTEKHDARSLDDAAAIEQATNDIYKQEFHRGVFTEPALEGTAGEGAKERALELLSAKGAASAIWELTGPVVARSMAKCHVKVLENQWFIDYKDAKWKERSKEHIASMRIFPESARKQFENTVDWLEEKACARRSGLGTVLPFDESWIVETLSDSTVYMAYYTISRFVNDGRIEADELSDEVFDYLYRGGVRPSHPKIGIIDEMKAEFEYFYPVDMRSSGKDLIQNHLTFFIMQHVALFDERFWPKGVAVNGYVSVEGEKMSKSRGNIIPFADLCESHGPDLVRANITSSADGMDDANWSAATIPGLASRLDLIAQLFEKVESSSDLATLSLADRLLIDAVNRAAASVAEDLEGFRLRSALQSSFFDLTARLRFALKGGLSPNALRWALERIVSMNEPFFPFSAAELAERHGFALSWPQADSSFAFDEADTVVSYIERVRADLLLVKELVERKGGTAREAAVFLAEPWTYAMAERIDEDLSSLMTIEEVRANAKEASKAYIQLRKLRPRLNRELERDALAAFRDSLETDTGLSIAIDPESDERKAGLPEKPGILVR